MWLKNETIKISESTTEQSLVENSCGNGRPICCDCDLNNQKSKKNVSGLKVNLIFLWLEFISFTK